MPHVDMRPARPESTEGHSIQSLLFNTEQTVLDRFAYQ